MKSASTQNQNIEKAEVLPFLNLQQVKADYALPFCEKKIVLMSIFKQ